MANDPTVLLALPQWETAGQCSRVECVGRRRSHDVNLTRWLAHRLGETAPQPEILMAALWLPATGSLVAWLDAFTLLAETTPKVWKTDELTLIFADLATF